MILAPLLGKRFNWEISVLYWDFYENLAYFRLPQNIFLNRYLRLANVCIKEEEVYNAVCVFSYLHRNTPSSKKKELLLEIVGEDVIKEEFLKELSLQNIIWATHIILLLYYYCSYYSLYYRLYSINFIL